MALLFTHWILSDFGRMSRFDIEAQTQFSLTEANEKSGPKK